MLAVLTLPGFSSSRKSPEAELGATALGLIALLSAQEVTPGSIDQETLNGLGAFLCFLQNEDGSFCSKFFPATNQRDHSFQSLYYPGEAILALTRLYKQTHNRQWLSAAEKGMSYLANSRLNDSRIPADNWALIATAELIALGDQLGASDLALFKNHDAQIINGELATQNRNSANPALDGCYTSDGRTTPTSTRLEGILSTLTCWPVADAAFRQRMEDSAREGIAFILHAQIQTGPLQGAFPEMPESLWGITPNRPAGISPAEVRIDFIQHALSAILLYRDSNGGRSHFQE